MTDGGPRAHVSIDLDRDGVVTEAREPPILAASPLNGRCFGVLGRPEHLRGSVFVGDGEHWPQSGLV